MSNLRLGKCTGNNAEKIPFKGDARIRSEIGNKPKSYKEELL